MIWQNYHMPVQLTFEELMDRLEYLNEMEVE